MIKGFEGTKHKTLTRHFHKFLDNSPVPQKPKTPRSVWLKVDAKYFGKRSSPFSFCIVLYKEGRNLIYWRFAFRETFGVYVSDMALLSSWGYTVLGITSDWHKSLVSSVDYVFKGAVPHQRCLIHLKNLSEALLTRNPKTIPGRELLELVRYLNSIKTQSEAIAFLSLFRSFENRYYSFLNERTHYVELPSGKRRWFYTHKNVRRVYRSIKISIDHLFLHIDYPGLDKDTNGLESEFSHLTEKIHSHRGLRLERKKAAISWYIWLKSLERMV